MPNGERPTLVETADAALLPGAEMTQAEAEAALQQMALTFLQPGAAPKATKTAAAAEKSRRVEAEAALLLTPLGAIESANEAAEQLFGWSSLDLRGRGLDAVLTPTRLGEPAFSLVVRGSACDLRFADDVNGRTRDGRTFPLEVSASALAVGDRVVVVATVRDLAKRRADEEQLRRSQARFQMLVEQIPAVTFMAALDEGLNEIYIGPQIETLLGFSQKEWLDSPVLWYWQLHPDDRAKWNEEFARGCATGGPFRAECRFIARDGRTVWVHGEARVIRDEDGRPMFVQGIAFDITESKRAEEQIRSAQDMVIRTERLAAVGQLAAGVAHDLRNPLGAIRNAWYYIAKKIATTGLATTDPRVKQLSGIVDSELARCALIIGELLDFSRSRPLFRTACSLPELLAESVRVVVKPAATIEIRDEVPPEIAVPYLDRNQFRQIVVNLLQNAVEAVDPRTGWVKVRARAGENDSFVLEVEDNGKGIPREIQERIFEPLFTTKLKGTGLGLAIVETTIKRHGGTITVASAPGAGTTFTLTFPRGEPSTGPAPSEGGASDLRSS
jgi:PAS domain S-box-containing protein